MRKEITLQVNDSDYHINTSHSRCLLHVLREDLDLTGAKYACGEGECGACMVLVDGEPMPACITPVEDAVGRRVMTIEGLANTGRLVPPLVGEVRMGDAKHLHPLQEAFLEMGALQCGYCTPGMIMSGVALLETEPNPNTAQIIEFMERNICRCGTYPRIIAAIKRAAEIMRGETNE
jgi:aerobic-type carbon monoxide dehydrogenase small subunit (CoxS/CutS family)